MSGVYAFTWIMSALAATAMLSRFNKAGVGALLGVLLGPLGVAIAFTMRDSRISKESAGYHAALVGAIQKANRK